MYHRLGLSYRYHSVIYRCISTHHVYADQQWNQIQSALQSGRIPPRGLWLDLLGRRYRAGMMPAHEIRHQFTAMLQYGIQIPSRYMGHILHDLIGNGRRDTAEELIQCLYVERRDPGSGPDLLPYDLIQICHAATPIQLYAILDRVIQPNTPSSALLAVSIRALLGHDLHHQAAILYDRIAALQQCPHSALQEIICNVHNQAEARTWISWASTTRRRLSRRSLMHLFDLLDPIQDEHLRAQTALQCALRNCHLTPPMIEYFRSDGRGRYGRPQNLCMDGHVEVMSAIIRRRLMWAYTHAGNHEAVLDLIRHYSHIEMEVEDYLICVESALRQEQWRSLTESILNNMKLHHIDISCAIWHRICNHCLNPQKSDIKTFLSWRRQYCIQYRPEHRFLFSRPLRYYLDVKQYDCVLCEMEAMLQAGYHDVCTHESTAPIVIRTYLALGWMSPHDLQSINIQDRPALRRIVQQMSPEQHLQDHVQDRHHLDVVIKSIIAQNSVNNQEKLQRVLEIFEKFTSSEQNPLPRTVFRLLRLCAVLDQVETAQHVIQVAIKVGFNFNDRRQRIVQEIFDMSS